MSYNPKFIWSISVYVRMILTLSVKLCSDRTSTNAKAKNFLYLFFDLFRFRLV